MATTGARSIDGGNFQLFEQFLKRSGANVYLNTQVSPNFLEPPTLNLRKFQVSTISEASSPLHHWTVKSTRGAVDYKAVILAAPYHSTDIVFPSALTTQVPKQPYIHLHVTLLATTSPTPDPAYFALPAGSKLPSMLLTTYEGTRNGGRAPEFNSLSYHGLIREGEWAVKIFSQERVSDEWLNKIFLGQVGWVHRKEVYTFLLSGYRPTYTSFSGMLTPNSLLPQHSHRSN